MSNPTTISGMLDAKGLKIAILATRFNDFIVDRLTGGALDYLERHGLDAKNITIVRIPGAFEMPLVCQKLAASGKYDGIVALGAVIRGATPHFDYVCNEASKGIAQVMLQYKTPIGFGLPHHQRYRGHRLYHHAGAAEVRQHRAGHRTRRFQGRQQGRGSCRRHAGNHPRAGAAVIHEQG